MANKKDLSVSEKELAKLKQYNEQLNQLNSVRDGVERGFRDALDLIGDRYGVDLISGEYAVLPDGKIVKAESLQKEGVQSVPQLLQEDK